MSNTFISFQALSFWSMGAKGTTLRGLILPEAGLPGKAWFGTGLELLQNASIFPKPSLRKSLLWLDA
jgi:hypothetical protein